MRIVRLEAANIKGLRAVEIEPNGSAVIVGGKTGAGKSSVLDSIFYALSGVASIPKKPIRKGEEKARAFLDLGDITVERKFTESSSTLTVRTKEGAKYPSPQAMLDALCARLAFDPLEFSRLDPKKQAAQLRALVGIDTTKFDEERKRLFEERTNINRDLARAKALLAAAVKHPDAPKQEVSLDELTTELERREAVNRDNEESRQELRSLIADRKALTEEIEGRNAWIAEREAVLQKAKDDLAGRLKAAIHADLVLADHREAVAKLADENAAEVKQQIRDAGTVNAKVAANMRHTELTASYAGLAKESEELTGAIDAIDGEKAAALETAPFPVEGLGFNDDGVTFNGLPFEQACSREKIEVSVAMGMALNPKFRVLLIREGSLLLDEDIEHIAAVAKAQDFQLWIEKVCKTAEGCTVFIQDGSVLEEEAAEVAASAE